MKIFLLCLTIFFCRILDVSLGTIRTVCTVKGKIQYSVIIGFIEVLIWFLVVREALNTDSTSIWVAFSYAGGYASGTLIGGLLAKTFIKTKVCLQVVTSDGNKELIRQIRAMGFGVTSLTAYGKSSKDKKYFVIIETDSKQLKSLKKTILANDPNAFITVHENKEVVGGFFSNQK